MLGIALVTDMLAEGIVIPAIVLIMVIKEKRKKRD